MVVAGAVGMAPAICWVTRTCGRTGPVGESRRPGEILRAADWMFKEVDRKLCKYGQSEATPQFQWGAAGRIKEE